MNEEFVTKSIIRYLKRNGWNIFAFDYPQSGTGFLIHPNDRLSKNKESLIPDIIANKDSKCIIMENKSYYCSDDFTKLNELKTSDIYSNDLNNLINRIGCNEILYDVGVPDNVNIMNKPQNILNLVDFLVTVNGNKECKKYLL